MINSVKKAMEIIDILAVKGPLSLKALSEHLGLPKSTVCRLAQTLETCGYLCQEQKNGNYLLSYKFFRVGYDILEKTGIRDCVMPALTYLAGLSVETVNLAVLDDTKVLYVEKLESSYIYNGIKIGARAPLHCTSTGKAILASLTDAKANSIINKSLPLEIFTEKTIADVDALWYDIKACRKRGYAIAQDEIANGVHSIGAPIYGYPGREAAAISIVWPSNRSREEMFTEWGDELIRACESISKKLKGS